MAADGQRQTLIRRLLEKSITNSPQTELANLIQHCGVVHLVLEENIGCLVVGVLRLGNIYGHVRTGTDL